MAAYKYAIDGTAADGQTWQTSGSVATVTESDLSEAINEALRQSFMQITQGKAIFGQPGLACRGPYRIAKVVLERKPDA